MLAVTEAIKDTEFQPKGLVNNVFETLNCLLVLILQSYKSRCELVQDTQWFNLVYKWLLN